MDGHINLEKKEKNRRLQDYGDKDFKKVKNFLETKNSFGIQKFKGIFLKNGENPEIWNVLCEKFMKLFIDRDFCQNKEKSCWMR